VKGETEFLILAPFVSSLNSYNKLFVVASPAKNVICIFVVASAVTQSREGKAVLVFTFFLVPTSSTWSII